MSRAVGLLAAALLAVAGCSQPGQQAVPPPFGFDGSAAATASARLEHGKRLVRLLGCQSCHGENLQGTNVTADDPDFGDMNASNVALLLPSYSDAQLERLIRHGEPKDGRTFWFMASESFQFIGDDDLAAIIAYLRTIPPGGKAMPPLRFGPGFRRAQASGEMQPAKDLVARFKAETPVDLGEPHAYGRWLAQAVCSECHNARLDGYPDFTPDLDVAAAYGFEGLDRLISTGQSLDGRDLGMMSETAKARLHLLTASERKALFEYLLARAQHDLDPEKK